jgi:hypothetical protein
MASLTSVGSTAYGARSVDGLDRGVDADLAGAARVLSRSASPLRDKRHAESDAADARRSGVLVTVLSRSQRCSVSRRAAANVVGCRP